MGGVGVFQKKRVSRVFFFIVFLTFALSSLSATIVFPILAPLFLGGVDTIIRPDLPEEIRAIVFGVFLTAFPLAQFLFAPLLGEYSDRRGRKKAFLVTIVLEIVGYLFSGFGIQYHHLSLLFLGRFITGLGAANFSVCLATLADVSYDEKSRSRYFSYGSLASGAMFVLGPLLGGRLSDPQTISFFSLAFPMWVGGLLALVNLIFIWSFFIETRVKKDVGEADLLKALHNVGCVFEKNSLYHVYAVFFFFLFGWNMLYQFLPALLVEEFKAESSLIGDLTSLMGVVWFLGTLFISIVVKFFRHQKFVLILSFLLFALTVIFIPFPKKLFVFVLITAVAVFLAGGIWPILASTISRLGKECSQGKTLGITQSIQSLSMLLAPFFGGFFLQSHSKTPFIFSAISLFVAIGFLIKIKNSIFDV
ncbi:MAG: MFS transporter [Chlamydiae bacterium]|nr:MFS transporter [Chlamydiota bacterium]